MAQLIGIPPICDFLGGIQHHTVFNWKANFGFPMKKKSTEGSFTWVAEEEEVIAWLEERKIKNPKEVSRTQLEEFEMRKIKDSGEIKKINRRLKGIDQILDFCGYSIGTVYSWYTHGDAPVKKENNILVADADQLLVWMECNGYITLANSFEKREFYSSGILNK